MYQANCCSNPETRTRSLNINLYFLWHNAGFEQRLCLLGNIKSKHCKKMFFVKSWQRIRCFELTFKFLEIKQMSMKCELSKPVVIFTGLGGAEVGGFRVIIWRKAEAEGEETTKPKRDNFYGGVDPQLFYQNCLPISAFFDVKRVLWCALCNIPSCLNLIRTRQLGKNQSLNQFCSSELILRYWFFLIICKW